MKDEENKKEAGSFAEPVLLYIEGVERRNEAINRFFQLRITRKCRNFWCSLSRAHTGDCLCEKELMSKRKIHVKILYSSSENLNLSFHSLVKYKILILIT